MNNKKAAWEGYLLAVHLALLALVVRFDVLGRLAVHAGVIDPPDHPFIVQMRKMQERLDPAIPAGSVLFLGDSNMQSMPVEEITQRAVNLGIGWQRSDQLLVSMRGYRSMQRASAVVIMIGTNDVSQGRVPRYREVLAAVPAGVPVVLVSAPPMAGRDMRQQSGEAARACAADPRCTFADGFAALAGKPEILRADGVHLTPTGYSVLIPVLRSAIRFRISLAAHLPQ